MIARTSAWYQSELGYRCLEYFHAYTTASAWLELFYEVDDFFGNFFAY